MAVNRQKVFTRCERLGFSLRRPGVRKFQHDHVVIIAIETYPSVAMKRSYVQALLVLQQFRTRGNIQHFRQNWSRITPYANGDALAD